MAKLVIGNNKTVGVPVITKEIEKLPELGLMRAKDANGMLIASTTESQIMDFTGVTDVDSYMLYHAYNNNTAISGAVGMSDLTMTSGNYGCGSSIAYCTGITSADLSALTIINGSNACNSMFQNCTGLTSVDLSSLTTISGSNGCNYMFAYCTGLTSANLSALTTITSNGACNSMFQGCTGLTSIDLSSLTTINGSSACSYMFSGCTSLTTVYIGDTTAIDFGTRYTNQFGSMFYGCSQNIDVYAPAANQAQIEAMSGYPNFGGTGTVTWHWRS